MICICKCLGERTCDVLVHGGYVFRYSDECSFVCRKTKTKKSIENHPIFLAQSVWNSRKDAIARQYVFTLVISGLHRTHMHIRPKLPRSTYRAVSDDGPHQNPLETSHHLFLCPLPCILVFFMARGKESMFPFVWKNSYHC